jgi:2-polyprenyl-3-methyl-5-hydroxy-6-metoxy-1,4-benzoquinol methylase
MLVGVRPEGPLEWLVQKLDHAPIAIADTHVAFTAARAIMAGTSLGIFDAIADGAVTADAIARTCRTDPRATSSLVDCLVTLGYVRRVGGRYVNSRRVERWLLERSPRSVRAKLLFQNTEWELLARLEEFIRTGQPIDLHRTLDDHGWRLYQDAMEALARSAAPILARKLALPRAARLLLDIGGAHGLHSIALCRRHAHLRSEVLDLPAALEHAPARLQNDLGGRLTFRAGDALRDELGEERYDVVLVNNLAHHLSNDENEGLARRAFRALRPGGIHVIGDLEKKADPARRDALDATMDLYFALTSNSGTWPLETMRRWQRNAGLVPRPVLRFSEMPGFVVQVAKKPARRECSDATERS